MSTRVWMIASAVLLAVIVALLLVLVLIPAPHLAPNVGTTATSTTTTPTTFSLPLSSHVSISSPQPNAKVGNTFNITGVAPNAWYFEAVFPIQVRDPDDNIIGRGQGHAQTDWMTPGLVPFQATITLDGAYHGPALLIILKDNPSGLPENSDEVTIPIVIQ